jgi:hypothetical protein
MVLVISQAIAWPASIVPLHPLEISTRESHLRSRFSREEIFAILSFGIIFWGNKKRWMFSPKINVKPKGFESTEYNCGLILSAREVGIRENMKSIKVQAEAQPQQANIVPILNVSCSDIIVR